MNNQVQMIWTNIYFDIFVFNVQLIICSSKYNTNYIDYVIILVIVYMNMALINHCCLSWHGMILTGVYLKFQRSRIDFQVDDLTCKHGCGCQSDWLMCTSFLTSCLPILCLQSSCNWLSQKRSCEQWYYYGSRDHFQENQLQELCKTQYAA